MSHFFIFLLFFLLHTALFIHRYHSFIHSLGLILARIECQVAIVNDGIINTGVINTGIINAGIMNVEC